MIGYISLFEAISAYHTIVWICSTMEFIEYFGLEWLFHWTFFFPPQAEAGADACVNLCVLNQRLGVFFF